MNVEKLTDRVARPGASGADPPRCAPTTSAWCPEHLLAAMLDDERGICGQNLIQACGWGTPPSAKTEAVDAAAGQAAQGVRAATGPDLSGPADFAQG